LFNDISEGKSPISIRSKVKMIISEERLTVDRNKTIKLSAAFGYATRKCAKQNVDTIIALADKRMY